MRRVVPHRVAAGRLVRVRASIKAGKDETGRTVLRREGLKTERSRRTLELPAAVMDSRFKDAGPS